MTLVAVAGSIPAPCHGDNRMSEGSLTFIFSSKKYWVKLLILTSLGSFLISGMIVSRLHSTHTPSQNVKCWWNYFYFICERNSRNDKHWSASQKITLLNKNVTIKKNYLGTTNNFQILDFFLIFVINWKTNWKTKFFNYKTFLPYFLEKYSSHVRKFIKKRPASILDTGL